MFETSFITGHWKSVSIHRISSYFRPIARVVLSLKKNYFIPNMGMAPPIITSVIRHNDNNVILGNRNILFASIPDLLWQFFDRLLLNHRKMRETDTNCSNGKRKKGKVGRFWVIVAAIIHFWFSCNIVLPCVVNSDFSPKLHCLQTMLFVIPGVEERLFLEWRGS